MTVAIAAAGTGGHVYPAVEVAEALLRRGMTREEILFIGGDRVEARYVPDAGYRFVGFELTKLRRQLSLENLRIPIVVRRTAAAMAAELRRSKAKALIAMSGYVTVPAALAARKAGVPFLVHEQNADGALASRFAARRARATLLGLPGKAERLPRSEVVGNPLRPAIAGFERKALRAAARSRYELDLDGPVVGVLGGSLGAQVLNEAAPSIAASGVAVLQLTGPGEHGVRPKSDREAALPWRRLPEEHEMEYFYAAADLVVCRAGGMTVSELAATATPGLLVPLERVGQMGNARALADAGGAIILRQGDSGRLPGLVASTLEDEAGLARMGRSARSLAKPEAAGLVADRVLEAAGG